MSEDIQKNSVIKYLQSIEPRIRTKGFRRAIFDIVRADDSGNFEPDEIDELWGTDRYNVRAHAYVIDENERKVYLFEVEGSSSITAHKLHAILDTYWFLEYIHWDLRLFMLDQFAGNWRAVPLFTLDMVSQAPKGGPKHEDGAASRIDWGKTYNRALDQSWCFPALTADSDGKQQAEPGAVNVIEGDLNHE